MSVTLKDVCKELNVQTKEINRANNVCCKSFWTVFLAASIVMFIYQASVTIMNYTVGQTVTTYQEQSFEKLAYPGMLLCARYPFNGSELQKWGFPLKLLPFLQTVFLTETPEEVAYDRRNFTEWQKSYERWKSGKANFNLETFVRQTTVQKEQIFPVCYHQFTADIGCQQFSTNEVMFDYSTKCFDFLKQSRFEQTVLGKRGKVTIAMVRDINPIREYLPNADGAFEVHLMPKEDNLDMLALNPAYIVPGNNYEIKLVKQINRRNTGNCAAPNLDNLTGLFETCRRTCELKHNLRLFNCTTFGTTRKEGVLAKICDPGTPSLIAHNASLRMDCSSCHKSTPCVTVSFQQAIVIAPRRSTSAVTAYVDLYYEDLVTQLIDEHVQITFAALMGSIGGEASLLLGFKLATFVQLIYYTMLWCHRTVRVGATDK